MSPAEFMQFYETATNTHDLDVVMELIADDAIYLFSNQSTHIGKVAIRKAIQANFDVIKAEIYRTHDLIWLVTSTNVAACAYEFDWSGEMDRGRISGGGRGTTVIRRVNGHWRVVHEHLSHGRLKPDSERSPLR